MSMKTLSTPRRVYNRKGVSHVCFAGRLYGRSEDATSISLDRPVTCTVLPSDGGRARAELTQVRSDGPAIVETWRSVVIPRTPRA